MHHEELHLNSGRKKKSPSAYEQDFEVPNKFKHVNLDKLQQTEIEWKVNSLLLQLSIYRLKYTGENHVYQNRSKDES